ncbi:hypothetical protein E6W39_00885 [Kitasatospora acidiphila]|uniref:Uncharacterized protein n=1 Tax=Kitasatospora acidiphila TaxID=2567942 RepID=A0A540WFX4_9ACTN|nr:hypothetical protein [Kitasatospora acidiphila]TQF07926.1 hypothetical protein E6W39_00885 [Kitasatospora acidiphila]
MISTAEVTRRAGESGVMPLLTLEEFFEGNNDEGSIAPNQWEFGRPPVADLAARLYEIEQRPDVVWVRVQLHPETLELGERLCGEAVAICTTADAPTCESWISGFESDGVLAGLVDEYIDIPGQAGGKVWSVVWD